MRPLRLLPRCLAAALLIALAHRAWQPPSEGPSEVCPATAQLPFPLLVLGGQGGSGTRGVWELLYRLNAAHSLGWHFAAAAPDTRDSLAVREALLVPTAQTMVATYRGLGFDEASLHPGLRGEVLRRLCALDTVLLAETAASRANWTHGLTVVKEPLTQYLLPLLAERHRGRFHFLHLTRDVRSISSYHVEGGAAFTRRYLGAAREGAIRARMARVLGRLAPPQARRPLFMAMWGTTQADVRAWAAAHLDASEYHQLRVESVFVERDTQALRAVLAWLGAGHLSDGQLARLLEGQGGHAQRYEHRNMTPALRLWAEEVAGASLRDLGYRVT